MVAFNFKEVICQSDKINRTGYYGRPVTFRVSTEASGDSKSSLQVRARGICSKQVHSRPVLLPQILVAFQFVAKIYFSNSVML